jgi:small-conductance mechanosensitive channel
MDQSTLMTLFEVVAIIAFAWLIGHFLSWGLIKFSRRAGVSQPQRVTISRWVRVLIILIAILGILRVVGLQVQLELLTVGAVAVIIFSMTLQGVFANILSVFQTFKEDTLRLGDVIELASGLGKGHVVKVGFRDVWIKTEDGALVVLGHTMLDRGRYRNYTAAERLKNKFDA